MQPNPKRYLWILQKTFLNGYRTLYRFNGTSKYTKASVTVILYNITPVIQNTVFKYGTMMIAVFFGQLFILLHQFGISYHICEHDCSEKTYVFSYHR